MASIVPLTIFGAALFALTTYISIDTSFKLGAISGNLPDLRNLAFVPLVSFPFSSTSLTFFSSFCSMFTLTLVVPAAFAVLWFILTIWVVAGRLREMKPAFFFTAVFVVCAIGSQLVYWLAGKPLCEVGLLHPTSPLQTIGR